ncbi:hypothetical protein FLACOL_01341 [Flavobacterium columnare]|uniref:Uncharacterized protein n=1 Tax=Flavobacterium columnare TaxID=996 RepID=A0A2N9PAE6_9FLAO|nr:hypothetical protein FLACOL_01341 [Flavobacterium columnare]
MIISQSIESWIVMNGLKFKIGDDLVWFLISL